MNGYLKYFPSFLSTKLHNDLVLYAYFDDMLIHEQWENQEKILPHGFSITVLFIRFLLCVIFELNTFCMRKLISDPVTFKECTKLLSYYFILC